MRGRSSRLKFGWVTGHLGFCMGVGVSCCFISGGEVSLYVLFFLFFLFTLGMLATSFCRVGEGS